jgi:ABC-type nitrate/sulfonate/bicarbonate transport system substrate-binding protein
MLVSGKLDVLIGALSPALANSASLGTGAAIVLARESAKPDCSTWGSIYGRNRSFPNKLADFKELRGKKISYTNRGAITEFALDLLVEAGGLTRREVHGVILRQGEAMGALAAGQIDGALMTGHAPKGAGALAREATLFPGVTRIHPGQQTGFVVFGNRLRKEDRATGRSFLRALLRGSGEYLKGRTPAALDKLAADNGIDPEAARTACRDSLVPDGKVDHASIQRYLDWAYRKKYIETPVSAGQLVDGSVLAEVNA